MSDETIEVEAEPLEDEPQSDAGWESQMRARLFDALGPIIAGVAIDLVDAATIGGLGAKLGFPIGVVAGWYISRRLPLSKKQRVWFAVGCGVYCLLPGTHMLPLGTVLGFVARAGGVVSGLGGKR
ncbi:MAG: hypothetical protein GY711_11155 [bacterium]|nr:hypothetical protein [bacterium]